MPYLTGTDQQQKRAFVAIKVLGNTKLMVDLAASEPRAPGARQALRDVEFYATTQDDRNLAINVLSQFEFAPSCKLPFQSVAVTHPIDLSDQSCGMFGDSPSSDLRLQNLFHSSDWRLPGGWVGSASASSKRMKLRHTGRPLEETFQAAPYIERVVRSKEHIL